MNLTEGTEPTPQSLIRRVFLVIASLLAVTAGAQAQGIIQSGTVTGSLQADFQYYQKDTTINFDPFNKGGMNVWGDISYQNNAFTAGIRFEAYQPPLVGYPSKLKGQGIPYKYIDYTKNNLSVTLGSYYEQFGNGLLLRTYQDKGLGFDNALTGARLRYNISDKVYIKALAGRNRYYWEELDESYIRGADIEIYLSDFVNDESKFKWKVGGSYVNRQYPPAKFDTIAEYIDAYAVRNTFQYKNFMLEGEWAFKSRDSVPFIPHDRDTIGNAYMINATYATKGFGFVAQYKSLSQFDFRSNPFAQGLEGFLNFPPPISKLYSLKEFSRYPFTTTGNNESGVQLEATYSPKRGKTFLLNYSKVHDFDWKIKWYEAVYAEIDWKLSKKLHTLIGYNYIDYNFALQVKTKGQLFAHIYLLDLSYRLRKKTSIRIEGQYLTTAEDLGDWFFGLVELTIAPHFSFAIIDEVNLGDAPEVHYPSLSTSYTRGSNKFILSAGRQSQGFLCAGGVCRLVPAYTGVGLTVLSSF